MGLWSPTSREKRARCGAPFDLFWGQSLRVESAFPGGACGTADPSATLPFARDDK
jgi:hypothetical protein